jgi:hypothetical protein
MDGRDYQIEQGIAEGTGSFIDEMRNAGSFL